MTICDVCRSSDEIKSIEIKINLPDPYILIEGKLDLCSRCMSEVSINSFLIGMKTIDYQNGRNKETK